MRKLARMEVTKDLQSTLLLRRRKELKDVQAQLERKRLEFKKRMDECAEKHDELRSKQRALRENVQKLEKFLRDNDAKRQRALAKALTERKMRELKELELVGLHDQLRQEASKSGRIKRAIEQHLPFERYLLAVIASLPIDYLDVQDPHINDVVQRHTTLAETNHDLQGTLQSRLDEIERESNRLNDLLKLKNNRILVYNSQLGALQKRLDRGKAESARVEAMVAQTLSSGKARMRILSETKLAINNIYRISQTRVNGSGVSAIQASTTGAGPSPAQSGTGAGNAPGGPGQPLLGDGGAFHEKLAAIMDRVLDMTQVVEKADQFIRDEREKQRLRFKDPMMGGGNVVASSLAVSAAATVPPSVRVVDFAQAGSTGGVSAAAAAAASSSGGIASGSMATSHRRVSLAPRPLRSGSNQHGSDAGVRIGTPGRA
ncbi:hypothetical protein BC828DRAFT_374708 [Blastocladiella britannica]|nr:hypothetical protein BC828DRAFT_374708 [Blastocladiella britannica]